VRNLCSNGEGLKVIQSIRFIDEEKKTLPGTLGRVRGGEKKIVRYKASGSRLVNLWGMLGLCCGKHFFSLRFCEYYSLQFENFTREFYYLVFVGIILLLEKLSDCTSDCDFTA
jgi:hypothetical protein